MSRYPYHTRIVYTNAKIETKQGEKDPLYHTRYSNNPSVKVTEQNEDGEEWSFYGKPVHYTQNFKVKTGTDYDNGYFYAVPDGNFLVTYTIDVNGKQQEKSESFAFQPYQQQTNDLPNQPVSISELLQYQTIIQLNFDSGSMYEWYNDGVFYSVPNGKYLLTYEIVVDGILQERSESFDFLAFYGRDPREINLYVEIQEEEERKRTARERALEKLENNVNEYVRHGTSKRARAAITEVIDELWPTLDQEITVFRGQTNPFSREILTRPDSFFSTSTSKGVSVAKPFFSFEDKCCLFILHVQPGVKYYKVTKTTTGLMESEYLIEGNGRFYQDREQTTPGFRELTMEEVSEFVFKGENYHPGLFENNNNNTRNRNEIHRNILKNFERSFGPKTHTKNGKTLEQKSGIFEAYYFPPADKIQGGKRRKTYKNKKNKRRHTRKH